MATSFDGVSQFIAGKFHGKKKLKGNYQLAPIKKINNGMVCFLQACINNFLFVKNSHKKIL